ncbi:hypothetical protein FRB94_010537 [Tulasnella sp. JGI-2019a]|nr:hypothetical protein FRB94_010537 [Tulasnella sp. JGI-2019a]KAG9017911.1 hypothetical protein FRB93_004722 [Tulasnella sp. JGI-2019a]
MDPQPSDTSLTFAPCLSIAHMCSGTQTKRSSAVKCASWLRLPLLRPLPPLKLSPPRLPPPPPDNEASTSTSAGTLAPVVATPRTPKSGIRASRERKLDEREAAGCSNSVV